MADKVQSKLEELSGKRTSKVSQIKTLEAKLRKAVTDAEAKDINLQLKALNSERIKIEKEYNDVAKLRNAAKEYASLNQNLKDLNESLARAEARGEDTISIKRQINKATGRLNVIAPEVEKAFPEIKVASTAGTSISGPDQARADSAKPSKLSGSSGTVDTGKVSGITKTPEQIAAEKAKADAAKAKANKSTIFTEPMTISGQVSTAGTTTSSAPKTIDEILALAYKEYNLVDSIFKSDPSLQALLLKAIQGPDGKVGTGDEMKPAEFQSELQNTDWFKSNADAVQKRGFYQRQYNELLGKIDKNDPNYQAKVDQLNATSTYGRGLAATKRYIEDLAIAEGAVLSSDAALKMAQDIYDLGNENNASLIRSYVRSNIKYVPGTLLGGQAGQDLAALKQTAAANGIDFDKAFGGNITGWLQKIDQGESVETYKQLIRNAAKMGLPEKVGALLDKGVDLETIYAPYKNIMASTLEINPQSITLSDPTLRAAIGPDKEQTLYDYERALRKDSRWQYTNNARQETSDAVTKVLQDFGFRG